MHLLVVGMDHRTAPLGLRERAAWPAEQAPAALAALTAAGLDQVALLCTCNRTEIYACAVDPAAAAARATAVLADRCGLAPAELRGHLQVRVGAADTLRHLCRVACGLESLVLGETQVLAQVKDAYQRAAEAGSAGKKLHGLFHQALFCAKRVHAETALAAAPWSVGAAAVELARRSLGDLGGRSALLLGAGEAAETVARRLREAGLARIDVVGRTPARTAGVAAAVGGTGWALGELRARIADADVLVSSTSAPAAVVTPDDVGGRAARPLLIVDIAVPRDVDPAVGQLPGVHLCNIDDLESVAAAGRAERAAEASAAEAIIDAEVARFAQWLRTLDFAPLLRALTERMDAMAEQQAARALRRLPELSPREQALVRQLARTVVHKAMDEPLRRIRELGARTGAGEGVQALSYVFGLDIPAGPPGAERGA